MTLMQILNQLYADKKITLSFPTAEARETFRVKLYKLKKKQDEAMSAVLDEARLVLCTKKVDVEPANAFESGQEVCKLVLWTEEVKHPDYSVISVEDREDNDAGQNPDAHNSSHQTVRDDLAPANGKSEGPS